MQLEGSFHDDQGQPYLRLERITHQLPLPEARPAIPDLKVTNNMRKRLSEWSAQACRQVPSTPCCNVHGILPTATSTNGEATEIQSAMEASTLGSVVHWVMEHGLSEAEGHMLEIHHLDKVHAALDDLLAQALETVYNASLSKGEKMCCSSKSPGAR